MSQVQLRRSYTCVCALAVLLFTADRPLEAADIYVPAGGNLQAALDSAQPGDTIRLQAGALFQGKYTLPAKANPNGLYITIRSAADDALVPPPGTRMSPQYASLLPKLRSADTLPVLSVPPGASYWRVQLLEFQANVGGSSDIVRVGSHLETDPAAQPHHIVFDRVYVHGDPAVGQRNGIVAHASHFVLRDSYVSDIKLSGTETHAFLSYNGPGPYLIENNYLEASGINVMFGGADPRNASMIPGDITVRRNLVAKNPAWMSPRPDGKYWTVKNLFELKAGRRVLVEGNVFEHNWNGTSDQPGFAVLMRTENQSGVCDWCETGPVTFQHNIVRRSPGGFSLVGLDYPSGATPRGVRMHDVVIRNNLFTEIDNSVWRVGDTNGTSKFALVSGVERLTIDHNTFVIPGPLTSIVYFSGSAPSADFVYTNNMSEHKVYGFKGDGTAIGLGTLAAYTTNAVVVANVLAGGRASSYPTGNHFPAVTTWQLDFVDYAGGDYRLQSSSPYTSAATDGTALGANIDQIMAAIGSTAAGDPPPPPPNAPPSATSQSVTTDEDTSRAVLLGGSDPDGDTLTFAVVSGPAHGALSGTAPALIYTPAPDYHGADSFSFTASDGKGGIATGTVTISVAPVNDAPVALSQTVSTTAGTPVAFTLAGSDVDGDALAWSTSPPRSGTLAGVLPAVTYTPGSGFTGTDSFAFTVSDGLLASTATVTITVAPGSVHVADLEGASTALGRGYWEGTVRIRVHDGAHAPVPGAQVMGRWSGGVSGSATCTTNAAGECSIATGSLRKSSTTAVFSVAAVASASASYVPQDNHDSDGDTDGTSVTVRRP